MNTIKTDKKYNVFFTRSNKERYWKLEKTVTLYGFKDLIEQILEKTEEPILYFKLEKIKKK